jgi:hypothetical protein
MKKDCLLKPGPRITTTVLLTVVILVCATVVNAAEENLDDRWRFTITPYIWLPGISGSMKLEPPPGSGSGSAGIGSGGYLENLTFAGMLDLQVQKGRLALLADIIYLDFTDDNRTAHFPGDLSGGDEWTVQAETGLQAIVFEFAGACSVFRNDHLNFDLIAGVRYAGIDGKVSLDITEPLPAWVRSQTFSRTENFADPIIGFRGRFELGRSWSLPCYFDIGGFSVDSDVTLQAFAGIGYRFCDWFSMVLGYRCLYYDFGHADLLKAVNLYGTTLGLSFTL